MDIVLTLVVKPDALTSLKDAVKAVTASAFLTDADEHILNPNVAVDLKARTDSRDIDTLKQAVKEALAGTNGVDFCMQSNGENRRKKMLIADMDSTMITIECIDELADFVGVKEKVAAITEAAMRGELNFEAALKERVALLEGLTTEDLEACYRERVVIMPGAATLLATMRANGAFTALVSGGFTFFTDRVADKLGFAVNRANILDIQAGKLTGKVIEPICGAESKLTALKEFCVQENIDQELVLAVGDGANDIPMLMAAGLGVAYHAKPKTAVAAHASVNYHDLTALLYYQGYHVSEFVQPS